jgi:hypothetical protein
MAEHLRQEDSLAPTVALFTQYAKEARQRSAQLRQMVMQPPVIPPSETREGLPDTDDEPPAP